MDIREILILILFFRPQRLINMKIYDKLEDLVEKAMTICQHFRKEIILPPSANVPKKLRSKSDEFQS